MEGREREREIECERTREKEGEEREGKKLTCQSQPWGEEREERVGEWEKGVNERARGACGGKECVRREEVEKVQQ